MIYNEWTQEEKIQWDEWVATRPPVVQDLCARFPPNRLYLLKSSNHRVFVTSYSEDGTMRVCVSGQFNRTLFGRDVFGVEPADLEECDLPGPDEDVGDTAAEAGYTADDVKNILIPEIRKRMNQ